MDQHENLVANEELYKQARVSIEENFKSIRKELSSLRRYINSQKEKITKEMGDIEQNDTSKTDTTLEATEKFCTDAAEDIAELEMVFDEYFLRLKIDLLREARERMETGCRLRLAERGKACRKCGECRETSTESGDLDLGCRCIWKPIPDWVLEDTWKILVKPKPTIPSGFDESDLEFKKEIIFLRTKMFSLPKNEVEEQNRNVYKNGLNSKGNRESVESFWKQNEIRLPSINTELWRINELKFIDGAFTECSIWSRILDTQANQFGSKWELVLKPQIRKLMEKRHIATLHLNPYKTLDLLSKIPENGIRFTLSTKDLLPLVDDETEVRSLRCWRVQFRMIEGPSIAAALIQTFWRGYWLRKRMLETERHYVAASVLWIAWLSLKARRRLHQNYLTKMLEFLDHTGEMTLKLNRDFGKISNEDHVIIHMPSFGYSTEIRRTLDPAILRMQQNATSLRIAFVRNPKTEVIYILPLQINQDFLNMYSDLVESVSPAEDVAKRITFVSLSQATTFKNRSLNMSRILHCSEKSLTEIKKKIAGKPAFLLPWIMDECDLRIAGTLGIGLMSPTLNLQQRMLNASEFAKMVESFGLAQLPHATDIKDYDTLCSSLAELIVLNTEVCTWTFRINVGMKRKHCGIFLINHISIPFMPILRKDREKYRDEWIKQPQIRERYLKELKVQLLKVVPTVTRLSPIYKSWKQFTSQISKFGCLIQALPFAKDSRLISVCLFLSGKESGLGTQWKGTADKMILDSRPATLIYMIPQTSVKTLHLQPIVNKFASAIQSEGYFGYISIDFHCYSKEDKLMVLVADVHPAYSPVQSYMDWIKFAIGGSYNVSLNSFVGDVDITLGDEKKKSSYFLCPEALECNETAERYAIAVSQVYHSRFCDYPWPKFKSLLEKNQINYNAETKCGIHVILHGTEVKPLAMMIAISSNMPNTLQMTYTQLRKLQKKISAKAKRTSETNMIEIADYIEGLALDYNEAAVDPCG